MKQFYQFAISHFCEKARWALDYKKVDYELINLMPGSHTLTIRRYAPKSSVPVLKDDDKVIQGSAEIITWLDEQIKESPLTPSSVADKASALEWERYLDEEIGVSVRVICYHYLLQHKKIVIPLMCYGTPWYNRLLLRAGFSKLEKLMRKYMKLNEQTVEVAKDRVIQAVEKVSNHLAVKPFLVGEQFSRADLTAAALIAPLTQPAEYSGPRPAEMPAELIAFRESLAGKLDWALASYRDFRGQADLL